MSGSGVFGQGYVSGSGVFVQGYLFRVICLVLVCLGRVTRAWRRWSAASAVWTGARPVWEACSGWNGSVRRVCHSSSRSSC